MSPEAVAEDGARLEPRPYWAEAADWSEDPQPHGAEAPAAAAPEAAFQIEEAATPTPGEARTLGSTVGESAEPTPRSNKLVPTNAVHTTKRRLKRSIWQNHTLMLVVAGAVLGLLILGSGREPPDVSPLEQEAVYEEVKPTGRLFPVPPAPRGKNGGDARPAISDPVQAAPERAWRFGAPSANRAAPWQSPTKVRQAAQARPTSSDPVQAAPERPWRSGAPPADRAAPGQSPANVRQAAQTWPGDWGGLNLWQLVEIERILARLELDPSEPDGVMDDQTESAIRLYQQIAGLPVDGEPSESLLDDMREVVKILEGD
ncbi:MAG: peptidoglycan-binding protein [Kiloniellaceae bacterium]